MKDFQGFLASVSAAAVSKIAEHFAAMTLSDWAALVSIVCGIFYLAKGIKNWNKPEK